MILVADSGSTKCDWALLHKNGFNKYATHGFNPMFHSQQMVVDGLNANEALMEIAPSVKMVYYYGAGCQNSILNKIIEDALKDVFKNAEIFVDHDLTAAVRATCGNSAGISCILGTGSNLAYFDGKTIHSKIAGLGYILGDEGSGTYFGKQLLADFLYEQLPHSLQTELFDRYQLNKEVIIRNVYMKPHANVYLAQFMPLIAQYKNEPYVQQIVYNGLLHFVDVHVLRFDEYKNVPVHFVGSIAFFFSEILALVCKTRGITLGQVIKNPIENLVHYHGGLNKTEV